MKWFMTTNESSLGNKSFFKLLQVAVVSAQKNTRLIPHLVYDGTEKPRELKWLKDRGVTIVPFHSPLREPIAEFVRQSAASDLVDVRTGAYLKTEIPEAIKQYGLNDKYVLYTDCDVVFVKDFDLRKAEPRFLSAFGQKEGGRTRFHFGGWIHYNTGVMLFNVDAMHEETGRFRDFVLENGRGIRRPNSQFWHKNLFLSDQVAVNLFYRRMIDWLQELYNWNPLRGINKKAVVIHFNGLKWSQWEDFLESRLTPPRMEKFTRLIKANRPAFEYYVSLAQSYLDEVKSLD